MPLVIGDAAPFFRAATPANLDYAFDSVAGRYVVLAFYPSHDMAAAVAISAAVQAHRPLFDDEKVAFFGVLRSETVIRGAQNSTPGVRWFLDPGRVVSRLYGMEASDGGELTGWLVLDPMLRVIAIAPLEHTPRIMRLLVSLPPVDDHAGAALFAPVLLLPRVFDRDLCTRLIQAYETGLQEPSGFMREIDGRTVGVFDSANKRRTDHVIEDGPLRAEVRACVTRRLIPQIQRAFSFRATRMERYIVACYDGAEGGFFRPHRDDMSKGTDHRRFAVTINLNTEDYEGGDLVFPEFGSRTYRAPTGGAVVFSCSLLHAAEPVTAGKRYAFLPFLYDEAAAQLREQHARFLEPDKADYRASTAQLAEAAEVKPATS